MGREHFKPVVTYSGLEGDAWPANANKEPEKQIDFFDGTDYDFLSNFHRSLVKIPHVLKGWIQCTTVEAGFQAMKTMDPDQRVYIAGLNPGSAKFVGKNPKRTTLRPDWEVVKRDIMLDLLREKFNPGAELSLRLFDTGDAVLIEGNTWRDREWGQAPLGKGSNLLGQLLMQVRGELRAS